MHQLQLASASEPEYDYEKQFQELNRLNEGVNNQPIHNLRKQDPGSGKNLPRAQIEEQNEDNLDG